MSSSSLIVNEVFSDKQKYFNFILPIEGKALVYLNSQKPLLVDGALEADNIGELNDDSGFECFLTRLMFHINNGRTVALHHERYLQSKSAFNMINIKSI